MKFFLVLLSFVVSVNAYHFRTDTIWVDSALKHRSFGSASQLLFIDSTDSLIDTSSITYDQSTGEVDFPGDIIVDTLYADSGIEVAGIVTTDEVLSLDSVTVFRRVLVTLYDGSTPRDSDTAVVYKWGYSFVISFPELSGETTVDSSTYLEFPNDILVAPAGIDSSKVSMPFRVDVSGCLTVDISFSSDTTLILSACGATLAADVDAMFYAQQIRFFFE